jgi:hypothetical protein
VKGTQANTIKKNLKILVSTNRTALGRRECHRIWSARLKDEGLWDDGWGDLQESDLNAFGCRRITRSEHAVIAADSRVAWKRPRGLAWVINIVAASNDWNLKAQITASIRSGRSARYHCMTSRERKRKRTKVYGAIRAGGNICRAEEMLSLAEARRITGSAGEKLKVKHRAGHAVQSSGKRDIPVRKWCRGDYGVILLIIRAAGGVAVVVRRWGVRSATTRSQCNPESEMAVGAIVVNGVAENGPGGVIASEACDADAVEVIEGDDVAFPRILTADRPDGGIASGDATALVAQRHGSRDVGANLVALDDYASRTPADKDPVGTRVDYIASARRAAADRRVEWLAYLNAVNKRIQSDRASRVHADQVSLDRGVNLSIKLYTPDRDTVPGRVDYIASARCAATDCNSGAYLGIDPNSGRADRCGSRGIRAEIIALYERRVAVVLDPAGSAVTGYHVSGARRCAADRGTGRE